MKGRVNMKELTLQQQCEIQGGSLIATALLYLILGAAAYKIIKSKREEFQYQDSSVLNGVIDDMKGLKPFIFLCMKAYNRRGDENEV